MLNRKWNTCTCSDFIDKWLTFVDCLLPIGELRSLSLIPVKIIITWAALYLWVSVRVCLLTDVIVMLWVYVLVKGVYLYTCMLVSMRTCWYSPDLQPAVPISRRLSLFRRAGQSSDLIWRICVWWGLHCKQAGQPEPVAGIMKLVGSGDRVGRKTLAQG